MNTMDLVPFSALVNSEQRPRRTTPLFYAKLISPVRQAIFEARNNLLAHQRADGSWQESWGDFECDKTGPLPISDTLLAIHSLCASGLPNNHHAVVAAVRWTIRATRRGAPSDVVDLVSTYRLLRNPPQASSAGHAALPPDLTVVREWQQHCRAVETAHKFQSRIRPLLDASLGKHSQPPCLDRWYLNWLRAHSTFADKARMPTVRDVMMNVVTLLDSAAAGEPHDDAALDAACFLVDAQGECGNWCNPRSAANQGAGNHSVLNVLSTTAWALLALSRWTVAAAYAQSDAPQVSPLRLVHSCED